MTHTVLILHSLVQIVRDKGVFIALGAYATAIGAGWLALAASFN